MIEVFRKMSPLTRAGYSNKVAHAAARLIAWSLPCGLAVEHTNPFLGRITEGALVALWGKHYWKLDVHGQTILHPAFETITEGDEKDVDQDDLQVEVYCQFYTSIYNYHS